VPSLISLEVSAQFTHKTRDPFQTGTITKDEKLGKKTVTFFVQFYHVFVFTSIRRPIIFISSGLLTRDLSPISISKPSLFAFVDWSLKTPAFLNSSFCTNSPGGQSYKNNLASITSK
jgi:hypothetical protein